MRTLLLAPLLVLLTTGIQDTTKPAPKKPEVGKPAPALRLNDQGGKIVALGGKRASWTVLAFFPKAATPG
ncbi:MAG: hypothetical protein HOP15_00365 [Planctomycetes bacterium]|nr:hypothetical protein [Planctomycetota bacterium]